ncbi:MAG: DUF1801 domain-containing protein [Flavobacteriaceae bacterium]
MNPAEQYILQQPEPYHSILLQVQIIVEQNIPNLNLKYKWHLPFYYTENFPICYFNVTKGYVDICFWLSDEFSKKHVSLISENRKRVKSLRYYKLQDIDSTLLVACLKEAYRTKEEGFKAR